MELEQIKAEITALLKEIAVHPDDGDTTILEQKLREQIAAMKALGATVPAHLLQFDDDEPSEEDEVDEMWDNMPV